MKHMVLASLLVAAVGCSVEQSPATESSTSTSTEEVQADPAAGASVTPLIKPFCGSEWDCDGTHWFAFKADCEAACGVGNCIHEPHCIAGWTCP